MKSVSLGLWLLPAFHPQSRFGALPLPNPKQRFLLPTHVRGKASMASGCRRGPRAHGSGRHQVDRGPCAAQAGAMVSPRSPNERPGWA